MPDRLPGASLAVSGMDHAVSRYVDERTALGPADAAGTVRCDRQQRRQPAGSIRRGNRGARPLRPPWGREIGLDSANDEAAIPFQSCRERSELAACPGRPSLKLQRQLLTQTDMGHYLCRLLSFRRRRRSGRGDLQPDRDRQAARARPRGVSAPRDAALEPRRYLPQTRPAPCCLTTASTIISAMTCRRIRSSNKWRSSAPAANRGSRYRSVTWRSPSVETRM